MVVLPGNDEWLNVILKFALAWMLMIAAVILGVKCISVVSLDASKMCSG
jgi:hypothetical protein